MVLEQGGGWGAFGLLNSTSSRPLEAEGHRRESDRNGEASGLSITNPVRYHERRE